jgi:hypothetical protein
MARLLVQIWNWRHGTIFNGQAVKEARLFRNVGNYKSTLRKIPEERRSQAVGNPPDQKTRYGSEWYAPTREHGFRNKMATVWMWLLCLPSLVGCTSPCRQDRQKVCWHDSILGRCSLFLHSLHSTSSSIMLADILHDSDYSGVSHVHRYYSKICDIRHIGTKGLPDIAIFEISEFYTEYVS